MEADHLVRLVLADPRLLGKPYGKLFLDSLPPMTRTRRLDRVQKFFAWAGRQRAAEGE